MSKVFVNPAGQRDNLGDSVLRRPYLDRLRELGQLHVLTGRNDDYNSALGLNAEDHAYASRIVWLARAFMSLILQDAVFAVNAGEIIGSADELRHSRWQSVLALAARVGRGRIIACGLSIRPGTDPAATRVARFSKDASTLAWRDRWSRDAIGRGVVIPDWAFAAGTRSVERLASEDRPRLAIVMRGDRPVPDARWFDSVRALAESEGLTPLVVVQVRRDLQRARAIAHELGAEVLGWSPSTNHADQETIVRSIYRTSRAVVSDRIHALILGLSEGAVPLGTTTAPSEKIARTFDSVTTLPIAPHPSIQDLDRWQTLIQNREALLSDLAGARAQLNSLELRPRAKRSERRQP